MSEHHHGHHHGPAQLQSVSAAFVWGIVLNLGFVVAEAITGFATGSLALITDAGHNLSDVASLMLSLLAFRLAKARPSLRFSYGLHSGTILASTLNGLLLLVAVGVIIWEAVGRFSHPPAVPGGTVAWVAGAGIAVNGLSAWLFYRHSSRDLNVRGAFLHLAADAAVSAAVVVGGLVMQFSGWAWVDPVLSLLVAGVILVSSWGLLKDSFRLQVSGVPPGIDLQAVQQAGLSMEGVASFEHLHVWALSTTRTALTGLLVLKPGVSVAEAADIKKELRHRLEHLSIEHSTLETEFGQVEREEYDSPM